jgi:hypothetical protein
MFIRRFFCEPLDQLGMCFWRQPGLLHFGQLTARQAFYDGQAQKQLVESHARSGRSD